MKTLIRT